MEELNKKVDSKIVGAEEHKWKVLAGTFMAWMCDAQDFLIVAMALPLLVKEWGITLAEASMAAVSTNFGAAIGCFFWGPLADKVGRKKALILCIAWFGIFTFLCGFTENMTQLTILRALAGFGLGGEWSIGSALIAEFFPSHQRSRVAGFNQSAWPVGYLLVLIVSAYLLPIYGWRVLFYSASFALVPIVYIAIFVPESPIWLTRRDQLIAEAKSQQIPVKDLFSKDLLRTTVLTSCLCSAILIAYWGTNTYIPAFLDMERGLSLQSLSGYLLILNIGSFIGYQFFGWLGEKTGRRTSFMIGSVASAVILVAFLGVTSPGAALVAGFFFGLITSGYWAPLSAFLSESFPTRVRGTALGFCYAIGRVFTIAVPYVVGAWADMWGLSFALGLMIVFFLLVTLSAYLMKETKGTIITAD